MIDDNFRLTSGKIVLRRGGVEQLLKEIDQRL
ncbi:hypothetical protein [Parageobacillus thermoglucosidasius]|uniref:AbrB C-terminal domain-containing protein n=1 Tax=Parageobacillus thermoglucosidasius TaxID=1426 RepID=A0AB38R5L5_PARTM|nr:hypothetical protein IMI45_16395 [Parageobacillus thermoglucosidasius]